METGTILGALLFAAVFAVFVGFFAGILLWISAFPFLLRAAQQRYAQTYHVVLAFSVAVLAVFAVYLTWSAFAGFS